MENQQSIKTVLSFGAKSVDPQILEQLLVGRDKNAEYLFKSVEAIVQNGNNQQILVIGQRGMGKTHLLRVLHHRCQPFILKNKLAVAYLSEEEYGIANYFDFLTRILYSFIRWYENDQNLLQNKLEELQNIDPPEQTYFIERIIKDYTSNKPLLILAENFGDILNSMGPKEQGKFRAWMYNNNRISIIATSQSISDDFDKEDRPFYGFFNFYYLKPLLYKESLAFLLSLAKLDGKPEVVKHLKTKGKAQVKAIYQLVKGNHRLLVTFYEFLKTDTLVKLSNHFIKTVNDLKPYYETYIRYLPPQQQKIIRYIALARKPQQGASISKNCFIDPKSLSKQLSELIKKSLLEALPDQTDKRNKLYDINEPLLRISIEVGEYKEGITSLFIDFLALYYDEKELTTKKLKFTDLLKKCDNNSEKKAFQYEIQAIDKALTQKNTTPNTNKSLYNLLHELIKIKGFKKQYSFLKDQEHSLNKEEYTLGLLSIYTINKQNKSAISTLQNLSPTFVKKRKLYFIWAYQIFQLATEDDSKDLYTECINKCKKAETNNEKNWLLYNIWGKSLASLADINNDDSLLLEGLNKLNISIEYNNNYLDNYLELAYWQIAISLKEQNETWVKKAFKNFKQALSIDPDNDELYIWWGAAIDTTRPLFSKDFLKIDLFKEKFSQSSIENRLFAWKSFTSLYQLSFFTEMLPLLKLDLKANTKQLESVIIDWINNILANNLDALAKEDLNFLKETTIEFIGQIPELIITQTYIDTYEEYIINDNKNSIYELPKEQRLFFQKYILGEQ